MEKAMIYLIKHILALDDDNYEPPSQKSVSFCVCVCVCACMSVSVYVCDCLSVFLSVRALFMHVHTTPSRMHVLCPYCVACVQLVVSAEPRKLDKACCPS